MKIYSKASTDVVDHIARMQQENHPDLDHVTVDALMIFDDEKSSECVLKHHGYGAAAVIRITPLRDRALGTADAVIVIDRATWASLTALQKDALVDHELYHLIWVMDKEGHPKADALGRPKLTIRRHDFKLEGFTEIAQRHGENALEVIAAKAFLSGEQQLFFQFGSNRGRWDPSTGEMLEPSEPRQDDETTVTITGPDGLHVQTTMGGIRALVDA